jgi:prepilin-type N-terminal cleavage/methylation domain-containing protein
VRTTLSPMPRERPASAGFSMIEVIIVVALIAFVYTVALPQLNMRTGAEIAQKTNQLAADVRSAYDLSVLTGKTYRLVFVFGSGEYWLEEADRSEVYLGSEKLDRDPTADEEKDEKAAVDQKFQEYQELAGSIVADPESGKEIPPSSPVLAAKDALKKPTWSRVENMEWSQRSFGAYLMIGDMQAEHHGHKQDITELGPEARAMIYFFPSGYVEKAYIHLFFKKDDNVIDETQDPYTIVTKPYEGVAEVQPGRIDIDVHEDTKDE